MNLDFLNPSQKEAVLVTDGPVMILAGAGSGKVLPVGGIKEKALAAMRAGIDTIIIPWKNQKDLLDIPAQYRKKITFIPVKNIQEVLEIALVDYKGQLNLDQHKRIDKEVKEEKKPTHKKGDQVAA